MNGVLYVLITDKWPQLFSGKLGKIIDKKWIFHCYVWLPEGKFWLSAMKNYTGEWRLILQTGQAAHAIFCLWSGDSSILNLGHGFGLHETGSIFNYAASLQGLHKLFCSHIFHFFSFSTVGMGDRLLPIIVHPAIDYFWAEQTKYSCQRNWLGE